MKHIPNILSVIRILLIPFYLWQILAGNTLTAGIILLASGITDFLDGILAREFGWISDVGKVLDPVADKLTQAAVSISMIIRLRQYWYIFAILIVKDLIMLVLGGWLLRRGVRLQGAKWFGKVSTFVFYTVMVVLLFLPGIPEGLVMVLLWVVAACAVLTALLYIPEFLKYRETAAEMNSNSDAKKQSGKSIGIENEPMV